MGLRRVGWSPAEDLAVKAPGQWPHIGCHAFHVFLELDLARAFHVGIACVPVGSTSPVFVDYTDSVPVGSASLVCVACVDRAQADWSLGARLLVCGRPIHTEEWSQHQNQAPDQPRPSGSGGTYIPA